MKRVLISLLILTSIIEACVAYSTNYYVSVHGNNSGCAGDCPITKPCTFQAALHYAQTDNLDNVIHVAAGVYDVSIERLEYNITSNSDDDTLSIIGENATETILDGGNVNIPLSIGSNGYYDLYAGVSIENLTFTHGSRAGLYADLHMMYLSLTHNRFIENGTQNDNGGGAYVYNEIGDFNASRNTVRSNTASSGGGFYLNVPVGHIKLYANEFSNNSASATNGGALYLRANSSDIKIINNIVGENTAQSKGGGVYISIDGMNGNLEVVNNTIINNASRTKNAGGLYAITSQDSTEMKLYNNIIWNNHAQLSAGENIAIDNIGDTDGSRVYVNNNLGSLGNTFANSAKVTAANNFWISGSAKLSGWITLDDARRSIRPIIGSIAIDNGDVFVGTPIVDYEGKARAQGRNINIGAVEEILNPMPPLYYLLLH